MGVDEVSVGLGRIRLRRCQPVALLDEIGETPLRNRRVLALGVLLEKGLVTFDRVGSLSATPLLQITASGQDKGEAQETQADQTARTTVHGCDSRDRSRRAPVDRSN